MILPIETASAGGTNRSAYARAMARRTKLAVAAALAAAALVAVILLVSGGDDPELVPGAPVSDERADPLAYDDDRRAEFERRAAAGFSHVLYAKSPGGAAATARRVERWRPEVEAAARAGATDADLLEAIVFVESAGRPEVIAGDDPEAASGLTQILAETGANLLDMRVDLRRSRSLTKRIARAEARGRDSAARRLRAARRRIDDRFDPAKALAATTRYLAIARERFDRDDLAVASYHMGIGNLERVLATFDGGDGVSYARLYFESTPMRHATAAGMLAGFGDDSATYLWRVYAAREIMRLYREDPVELERLSRLHGRKNSAEEVLHPPQSTRVFATGDDLRAARSAGDLLPLPDEPEEMHFEIDPQMGELARRVDERPEAYRALRPEALALLRYLAAAVHAPSGGEPLTVTSTVRDLRYQRLLRSRNSEAARDYSLHTTGYAFDVLREYSSRTQALAFEYWLGRLQALNLIAWVREPRAIHVTVSSEAARLESVLEEDG